MVAAVPVWLRQGLSVQLYVAYMSFKAGTTTEQGMAAYARRLSYAYPERAQVLGEYWVNGSPQVVVIWEAEDEGPGDMIEAAWSDLFEVHVYPASRPQLTVRTED
jgi:hypothetical protein